MNAFRPADTKLELSVVPLIGGSLQTAPYFQINEMVRLLAEKSGGAPSFIHAPALVSDREERDMYLNTSSMQAIRQPWKTMDVVVSGIGAFLPRRDLDRENYAGEHEVYRHLKSHDAVGDICARYFDRHGRFIVDDYYESMVGVPVEDLKGPRTPSAWPRVTEKAEAIVGVLKTGMVEKLVMDEQTARAALDFHADRKR